METCKARICISNPELNIKPRFIGSTWNDFKKCDKTVFQDNFCKKCFSDNKQSPGWPGIGFPKIQVSRWKRDGIYGQPYDFPYHVLDIEKKWVAMIYDLHPSIKPKKANELTKNHDQMIDNIKQWIEKYSKNISYEMGLELSQIIH